MSLPFGRPLLASSLSSTIHSLWLTSRGKARQSATRERLCGPTARSDCSQRNPRPHLPLFQTLWGRCRRRLPASFCIRHECRQDFPIPLGISAALKDMKVSAKYIPLAGSRICAIHVKSLLREKVLFLPTTTVPYYI